MKIRLENFKKQFTLSYHKLDSFSYLFWMSSKYLNKN